MNTQDAKRLFTLLAENYNPKESFEKELTELFVPAISLNPDKLTLKSSLHGRISNFLHVKDNHIVRREKIKAIFDKAIKLLGPSNPFFSQFPLDFRNRVITHFQVAKEARAIDGLNPMEKESDLILRMEKIKEEQESSQKSYFKKYSLLHQPREACDFTLSAPLIQALLSSNLNEADGAFLYLREFLRRRKTLKNDSQEIKIRIEEGKQLFESLKEKYLKQKEIIPSFDEAKTWAEKLHGLKETESLYICSMFGGTPFQNIYKLFQKLPDDLKPSIKNASNGNLPDPKKFVEEKIHESFEAFKKESPELPQELKPIVDALLSDPKRSLPESVKKWVPQFVGTPIEKLMQTGLLKTLLFFLPEGKIAELLEIVADRKISLEEIEKKVIDFFCGPLNRYLLEPLEKTAEHSIHEIFKFIPSTVADLVPLDEIISTGHLYFTFKKTAKGTIDFSIYSTGPVLKYHEKAANGSPIWPLVFEDINLDELNANFFHKLHTFLLAPLKDQKRVLSLDDFMEGILQYLNKKPSLASTRVLASNPINEKELVILMLSDEKDVEDLRYRLHKELLLDFWRQKTEVHGGAFNFQNSHDFETLINLTDTLKNDLTAIQDKLDRTELKRILETLNELETLIEGEKKALSKKARIENLSMIPKPLQTFIVDMGFDAHKIAEYKPTLIYLFGEEVGRLADQICVSLEKNPIPLKPFPALTVKAVLRQVLSFTFIHTAITCLRIAFGAAGLTPTSIPVFLIIQGGHALLKHFLPEPVLSWYMAAIDALERFITQCIWRIIYESIRLFLPEAHFNEFKGGLEALQEFVQQSARSILGEQELKFSLQQAKAIAPFPVIDSLTKTHPIEPLDIGFVRSPPLVDDFSKGLDATGSNEVKLLHNLNRVESLPIPQADQKGYWDSIQNPQEEIRALYSIFTNIVLSKAALNGRELKLRAALALFSLLAAIDRLARRDKNNYLEDLQLNILPLLFLATKDFALIEKPDQLARLEALKNYFYPASPEKQGNELDNYIKGIRNKMLFDYSEGVCSEAEKEYYFRILNSTLGRQWYAEFLKGEMSFPLNQPLPPTDETFLQYDHSAYKVLFEESLYFNQKCDLLPEAFVYLKQLNLSANSLLTDEFLAFFNPPITHRRVYRKDNRHFLLRLLDEQPLTWRFEYGEKIAQNYFLRETKNTQHEILQAEKEALDDLFLYTSSKETVEPLDVLPRLCELFLKQKPLSLGFIEIHRDYFFTKNTKYLFQASPEYAEKVFSILQKLIKDALDSEEWLTALTLIEIELSLHTFKKDSQRSETCRKELLRLITKTQYAYVKEKALLTYVLRLPDNPSELSESQREEAVLLLVRGRFIRRISSNVLFFEHFLKYGPLIHQNLQNALFRDKLTPLLFTDLQNKVPEESLAYIDDSIVTSSYKFCLGAGLILYKDSPFEIALLKKAERFLSRYSDAKDLIQIDENKFIAETGLIEMIWHPDENHFSMTRHIEGSKYLLIQGNIPSSFIWIQRKSKKNVLELWLEATESREKRLLVQIHNEKKPYIYKVNESNEIIQAITEEGELEWAHPQKAAGALKSLSRFFFTEKATCWRRPGENFLTYIQLDETSFIKIENEGAKARYFDGEHFHTLSLKSTHESLTSIPSYLMIEGAGGMKEVLVPEGSEWLSAFLGRSCNILSLHRSFVRPLEEITKQLFLEKPSHKSYKYRILADGFLDSFDPNALLHLLLIYLLQGEKKKARFTLDRFLTEVKLRAVDSTIINKLFPLALMPPDFEDISEYRQKILSALQENWLLFPPKEKNSDLPKEFSWIDLLFTASVIIDLNKLQETFEPFRKLTQKEEYYLFYFLFEKMDSTIKRLVHNKIYSVLNPEILFELFQISPVLSERYRELRHIFGFSDQWKQTTSKIVSKIAKGGGSLMKYMGYSPPDNQKGHSLDFTSWKKMVRDHLIQRKFTLKNLSQLFYEIASKKIENPPLGYEETTPQILRKYFLSYYAISRGEIAPEKRDPLRRTWLLLKGKYSDDEAVLLNYLEIVLITPNISLPSSLLESALDKKDYDGFVNFFSLLHQTLTGAQVFKNVGQTAADISLKILKDSLVLTHSSQVENLKVAKELVLQTLSEPIRDFRFNYLFNAAKTPLIASLEPPVDLLDKANQAIDKLLNNLYCMAFEEHSINKGSYNTLDVKALGLSDSQKERAQRVNQSSYDFKNRSAKEWGSKFLGDKELGDLLAALKSEQNNLKVFLKEREQKLLTIIRPSFIPKKYRVTLADLHEAAIKGEFNKIGQKLFMNGQEIADLELLFMHFAVLSGRLEQINRACSHLDLLTLAIATNDNEKTHHHLEKLAFTIKEKRAYTFKTCPKEIAYALTFFEWMTKTILYPQQIEAIQRLYSEGNGNVVQELLMAFGKTFFGIPTINAIEANGKQIIFNIFPSPLQPTFTQDLSQRNKRAYRLNVQAFTMDRFSKRSPKTYQAAYIAFQSAKKNKYVFSSTKPDLQALELNLLDLCLQESDQLTIKGDASLESLKPSLKEIRETGKVVGDEGHDLFNQREELNYPVGAKKKLDKAFILSIERVIKLLIEDPELARLIKENQLQDLNPNHYKNSIVPELVKKLSSSKEFDIKASDHLIFEEYLSGKTEQIPLIIRKHPKYEEICLIRGTLLKLFKNALNQSVNIHFGRSLENPNLETIKPYHGNNNPLEKCTVLSPYEELVKTYLTYLYQGLTDTQADALIHLMKESSFKEAKIRKIDIEKTKTYKQFKKWARSADFKSPLSQENKDKIKSNPSAILFYIRKKIAPQISFWERALRSNPQNFASMFASLYFDSGTPYNEGVYHPSLKMLWDPGTIGEALHLIAEKNPADGIHVLKERSPLALLNECITHYFIKRKDISLIVDGGAWFKGISNEVVVASMAETLKSKRDDIKAIVFMNKTKEGDLLVYRDIAAGKDYPFSQCTLPKEHYVTYLDEIHGFGTNVPQAGSSVVLVDSQPLFCLLQNAFRLRSLKEIKRLFLDKNISKIREEGQKPLIYFAVTQKTALKISPGSDKIELKALINYVTDLEAIQAEQDNYQAFIHKVHDIVRRAILDKMLAAPSVLAMKDIFKEFKEFLVPRLDFAPSKLFGWIEKEYKTDEVLNLLVSHMEKLFHSSSLFTKEEKAALKQKMKELPKPPMPEKVTLYTDGNEIDFFLDDTLGKEATIEQNSEQENELNQEKESSLQHRFKKVYQESAWPPFNPRTLDFFTVAPPSNPLFELLETGFTALSLNGFNKMPAIYSAQDHLKKSAIEPLKHLAPYIDKRIWFSEHYLPKEQSGLNPCEFGSKTQCDLFEIIIHYTKKSDDSLEILKVGLLTQKESTQWKKALEQPKKTSEMGVMIYDSYTREAVAGDTFDSEKLKNLPAFNLIEGQLKYLSAEADYPKEIRKPMKAWLSQLSPSLIQASFTALSREKVQVKSGLSDIELMIAKAMNLPIEEAI